MPYVDALYEKERDIVKVVERKDGKRIFKEYPAEYMFYYDDPKGKFRTVYDTPVSKIVCRTDKDFQKEKRMHHGNTKLYESDFTPIARCLEHEYKGAEFPVLQTAFFDIEVDFDKEKGFAPPADPFNKVTAISIYLNWLDQLICLAIPPAGLTIATATEMVKDFPNTFIYSDEKQMLEDFMDIIQDADVVSGWNSEGFDIPYLVNRITKKLSKNDTRRFCLWDEMPRKRTFERYGAEQSTYDLVGRLHMDYMQLYIKYTYHEMHSYSLDAIAEYELGEKKVAYSGTLDDLYNKDFYKFIDYSRQDTALLDKLDRKLKFIDLANSVAHENTVPIPKTMGAVAVTEQAIINESHERGFIVPDKVRPKEGENTQAAGAYVAYPKKGLWDWIGSLDINSLYPSAIQALNMAPETIIGQVRPIATDQYIAEKMADKKIPQPSGKYKVMKGKSFAAAWEGLFGTLEYTAIMDRRRDFTVTIDWEGGKEEQFTAQEVHDAIFSEKCKWGISANGTIFTFEKSGIIPGLLKRWYAERKEMQAKLKQAYEVGNKVEIEYWDKRQLVKKINLNSLYGAILNQHCRFFDKRIGQSTTLTGRAIVKAMTEETNAIFTGKHDHLGETIIYNDTDSVYFSAWPVLKEAVERNEQPWNTDTAIALYDSLTDMVNDSFPPYMKRAFHCPTKLGALIKCGREVVGLKGLFITKKRYAILVIDNEGQRCDVDGKPGKIKAMGLDLKRSDTPVVVQDFLKDILNSTLYGYGKDRVIEQVLAFKKDFGSKPGWEKGSPKRVNNLTKYGNMEKAKGKANMPGHVRAAINWNNLRKMNHDNYSMPIVDGQKTIVCKLKPNPLGWTSVGYPTDEAQLPDWFKELPFDNVLMESVVIDQKVDNLLGVLKWNLIEETDTSSTFNSLFEF